MPDTGQRRPFLEHLESFPRNVHREHHRDVGEERQGEPLEDTHVSACTASRSGAQRTSTTPPSTTAYNWPRAADQERERLAHGRDVGGDVDRVRDDQQHHQRLLDQRPRIVASHDAGQAPPRHAAQPLRTHYPWMPTISGKVNTTVHSRLVPYEGATLRIGRDAARIVVGRAGDQARPEAGGEAVGRSPPLSARSCLRRARFSARRAPRRPPRPSAAPASPCRSADAGCSRCWPRRWPAARARPGAPSLRSRSGIGQLGLQHRVGAGRAAAQVALVRRQLHLEAERAQMPSRRRRAAAGRAAACTAGGRRAAARLAPSRSRASASAPASGSNSLEVPRQLG